MTTRFANGTKFAISQQLSAPAVITDITNANPAIASATVLPEAGDVLVLQSNWPELSGSVARAANPAAGKFTLQGVDTTNVINFPAGEGAGTYQIASDFLALNQVLNAPLSGGEQNFHDFQFVEDPTSRQRRKPTYKSAMSYAITMAYDPDLPWHQALLDLDAAGEEVVLRETTPAGEVIYYLGYVSFNGVPTKELNVNSQVVATFSINSDPIRYSAT